MDRSVVLFLLDLALIALAWFLRRKATKDPGRFWVYLLYGLQLGPRSDVKLMNKAELYDSGIRFIILGLICVSAILALGIVMRALDASLDTNTFLFMLCFGLALFSGMGFLGGLYLLLRGFFRG